MSGSSKDTPPHVTLDGFTQPNDARMMGVVMALASEVYILKAEVQRLTNALAQNDLISDEALEAAGQSEAMEGWLAAEQKAFTAELLRPWLAPDPIADTRPFMSDDGGGDTR